MYKQNSTWRDIYIHKREKWVCMIVESIVSFMQKVMFFSSYVKKTSCFPQPLTSAQEAEYIIKMKDGDKQAKDILINHNLRLVAHIVKKYSLADEADDLISVGSIGLIKAINSYIPNIGTQFSTYAAKCIENEILMLLRVNKKNKNTISIEDSLVEDSENNDITLLDLCFADDGTEKDVQSNIASEKLNIELKKYLTQREYDIVCMRYGLNNVPMLTQREVAQKLGISRSYISRLEKKALETMKGVLPKDEYL